MKWMDDRYNRRLLRRYGVQCETCPTINGRLFIGRFHGRDEGGTIRLGRDVVINSSFEANPIGGVRTALVLKGPDALIEIGDGAGISNALIAAREHVRIGSRANLGAGCKIMDTDFHSMDFEERMRDVNIPCRPVTIGDGAFIGTGVIVMKGVTIGERSVIGAGAVVVKSVPAGEIWGGNPARFLKRLA